MKSSRRGANISVEVLNVSSAGIWLYVKGKEYFLSYDNFPWFTQATISQINNVRLCHDAFLHWPDFDVDIELLSLENPDRYPLIYS